MHVALKNLGVKGPYVFVGHSLGGLVARVYAGKYPEETAGIVFVDHAFTLGMVSRAGVGPDAGGKSVPKAEVPPPPAIPPPPGSTGRSAGLLRPGGGGIEDDPNFSTLSARDRELHLWFMTHMSNQNVFRTNANINPGCSAEAQEMAKKQPHPLAEKPLIDVSTDEMRTPPYVELQKELLALSTNSKEMIAEKSSHFVIIDRPDVVTDAISRVVRSVRTNSEL